ncbi:MAG: glycosyltransferase family 4 protein [Vicinamibacteria bacterium]|nr:glycosyltransferase family 4 protein [Vicinamibacteria bacterium]
MKITLATEVFPPRSGGAGWSTRALALALAEADHDVTVVTTAEGPPMEGTVPVVRLRGVSGPLRRGRMVEIFRRSLSGAAGFADVIHAQHSLSALGALALDPGPRVVVTVRDHWPVCFWSTRMSQGGLCPRCSTANMWRCVDGRLPTLATPLAIPYMKWDLSSKQSALRRANAVIAVSEAIAAELREAALPSIHVLPNIVDGAEVNRIAEEPPRLPLPDRFVLFVGKLEANKGARALIPAMAHAKTALPLVVLGSGSGQNAVNEQAAKQGVEIHMPGWAERDDVLRAMKRATALVFPSTWPEPLSRVLLEALALGTPIAAMDTGGTSELIEDDVSGLLAGDAEQLGEALGRIVHDAAVRSRLKEGAAVRARAFSPAALIPRYEALYGGALR